MTFKKHNWVKYGKRGIKCEVKVLDEDDRRLDFFRFSIQDKKAEKNVGNILKSSYGINFSSQIKKKEPIDIKKIMKEDLGIDSES